MKKFELETLLESHVPCSGRKVDSAGSIAGKITEHIKRLLLFACILIISLSGFRIHAEAWTTPFVLTIYACGSPGAKSASDKNFGHTWVTIYNTSSQDVDFIDDFPIPAKGTISLSIWPDSMGAGGVFINREQVVMKGKTATSYSINITKQQLDKIAAATPSESYYHDGAKDDLWHNCTTYSTKMWNKVADKDHKISNGTAGVDVPGTVAKKIAKWKGAKTQAYTVKKSEYWANVYHVSKSKVFTAQDYIELSKNELTVKKNMSQTITAGFKRSSSINDKIKWISNDPSVAAVINGRIKGLKYGKCKIYAFYQGIKNYTTIRNVCDVKVTVPVSKITLGRTRLTIGVGKKAKVSVVSIQPSDATRKTVKWTTSNSRVAIVSGNGVVKGTSAGTATITASATDGSGVKASCKVTVTDKSRILAAYRKYLEKGVFVHRCKGTWEKSDIYAFRVVDINTDGIPELIVTSRNDLCGHQLSRFRHHCHVTLYRYVNGKVVHINGVLTIPGRTYRIWYSQRAKKVCIRTYSNNFMTMTTGGRSSTSGSLPSGYSPRSLFANNPTNRNKYCK